MLLDQQINTHADTRAASSNTDRQSPEALQENVCFAGHQSYCMILKLLPLPADATLFD